MALTADRVECGDDATLDPPSFYDTPCLHCGTRLGVEAVIGAVYPEPIGLVGFLHSTVCAERYAAEREPIPPRLVEVA